MNKPIRLSPSGPVIQNDGGGPFVPGPGCVLRLVQADCTLSQTNILIPTTPTGIGPTLGTVVLTPVLDNPNPALRYTASIQCDVGNPTTAVGFVRLYLDYSTDALSWTNAAANLHQLAGGANSNNGQRQISLTALLTDGESLGVTSAPPSAHLYVRARIACELAGGVPTAMVLNSEGGGLSNPQGTILLTLAETL